MKVGETPGNGEESPTFREEPHIRLMEEARKFGTRLVVAVNFDDSVRRLKGPTRPVNNEMDRAYLVASLTMVDAVVIFDPHRMPYFLFEKQRGKLSERALSAADEAPMQLMQLISPDIHVKGGDYRREDIPEAIFVGATKFVSFEEGYTTTGTIQKMKNID